MQNGKIVNKKEIKANVKTKKHAVVCGQPYATYSGSVKVGNLKFDFKKNTNGYSYITVSDGEEQPLTGELPTYDATKKEFIHDVYEFINKL